MEKKTMTVKEVAKHLETTEESVRTMIRSEVIPGAFAYKKKNSKRFVYRIDRKKFMTWSN